jgi:probable HAF family extracellular repeat protein
VSEVGHVAGTTSTPTGRAAFLWDGEQMLNLGRGTPHALGDLDQVVGTTNNGEMDRAFLWREGVMIDLNDVVPPSEFLLWHATGINSSGQIVAIGGEYGGLHRRGFLLNLR